MQSPIRKLVEECVTFECAPSSYESAMQDFQEEPSSENKAYLEQLEQAVNSIERNTAFATAQEAQNISDKAIHEMCIEDIMCVGTFINILRLVPKEQERAFSILRGYDEGFYWKVRETEAMHAEAYAEAAHAEAHEAHAEERGHEMETHGASV
jgi:hypothetical protein